MALNSYDTFFARALFEKLRLLRQETLEQLATGLPQNEYHNSCGYIRALDDVLALCDDVRKQLINPES